MYDDLKVNLPEGKIGDWAIEKETIEPGDLLALRYAMQGRSPGLGTFTQLTYRGQIWMSDTHAEIRDHLEAVWQIQRPTTKTVLIHGLGLGMIVGCALRQPHVESVTVVEINSDVIALVGPHYEKMAAEHGTFLEIINANALTWQPSKGARWDVVWHDIWQELCEDNRDEMSLLNRRFGRRAGWQGCWGKLWLDRLRRQQSYY